MTVSNEGVYNLYVLLREQRRAELGRKPNRNEQSSIYWRLAEATKLPIPKVKAIVKAENERRNQGVNLATPHPMEESR